MNRIFNVILSIVMFIYFSQPVIAFGDEVNDLYILAGKSKLLRFDTEIIRASITDTNIADVVVVSPQQILVNAKSSGSTSMLVWDKDDKTILYDVSVGIDVTRLKAFLNKLTPNEHIEVNTKDDTVVLQGEVEKHHTIDHINKVAGSFSEKVVNIMRVKVPQQIMLKVKFAEVKRTADKELGFDFIAGDKGHFSFFSLPNNMITDFESSAVTGEYTANATSIENLLQIKTGDFFFDWLFDNLEKKGLLRILAEPNLVAISGEEASFLAGGEFPIPIVYGTGGSNAVDIEYKEYGIKLNFTPHVTEADTIRLKVKPEVSILDHSAASVKLSGFSIPALITRKAETTVELAKGESLVIGGLISHNAIEANRKVAGLGDIPILGALFQSKTFERKETELLVLVTPQIVEPMRLPETEDGYPDEKIPELFRKQKPPYEDKQADEIKEYLNSSIIEDAKSLDELRELELQKELELKRAREQLEQSKKKQSEKPRKEKPEKPEEQKPEQSDNNLPKQNFTPRERHDSYDLNQIKKETSLEILKDSIAHDLASSEILQRDLAKKQEELDGFRIEIETKERLINEKQKKLVKKEKRLTAQKKIIQQKESAIDLLIEIDRRLMNRGDELFARDETKQGKLSIERDWILTN